jgi:hypothetical protein
MHLAVLPLQNTICCNWCKDRDEIWGCYEAYNVSNYDSYEVFSTKLCKLTQCLDNICDKGNESCCIAVYWGKPRLYHKYISVPMDEDECWIPRNVTIIRREIELKKAELLRQKCLHGAH